MIPHGVSVAVRTESMAKRVSIINFKGGVGKTTLAFHLGTGLALFHSKRVLLMDMDHQSSLSVLCLGAYGWQNAVRNKKTIDEVFRAFASQKAMPDDRIVIETPYLEKYGIYISRKKMEKTGFYDGMDLVPAALSLDDVEIELTASHQGNAIQSEWNKRTLICRWIEENDIDKRYDYIIFDCPPATKIVSQNAIAASHGYIIPVVPEAVMERGAPHLHQMVRTGIDDRLKEYALMKATNLRPMHVPDTKLVGVVVTRIQTAGGFSGYTEDHTRHLRSLQAHWRENLLKPYIRQGTGVSQALSAGMPVYDRGNTPNVKSRRLDQQFEKLTAEIKRRMDEL